MAKVSGSEEKRERREERREREKGTAWPLPSPPRALDLDWSDPDTLTGAAGAVLGLLVGIGAPLFYISRDEKDEGEW